jgi:ABC-type transporter Mla MlaB component
LQFLEPGNAVLRITVHEDSRVWRLNLSGKLAGPWVAETENVWRSAPHSGTQIEVDLKDVTGVDTAGRTLLAAMHQAGARLLAGGVENSALVSEIMRGQHPRQASLPEGCEQRVCAVTRLRAGPPRRKHRKETNSDD